MPHQCISVLDGNAFVVSDRHGDLRSEARLPPHGFFVDDTRFVSRWRLTIDGAATDILSCAQSEYFLARYFLMPPSEAFHAAPPVSVMRERLLAELWREQLLVSNHSTEPLAVDIGMEVATDFADLFEVKDDDVRARDIAVVPGHRQLVLHHRLGPILRETRVTVSEDARVDEHGFHLALLLGPGEEREVSFTIIPRSEQPERTLVPRRATGSFAELRDARSAEVRDWIAEAPVLEDGGEDLRRTYARSLADLAALRLYPQLSVPDASLPAAGLPWFLTLFGRDSLITSYQALPFRPDLARTTLVTLAERQGTVVDDVRDEEPGKILHEVRFGELTALGERPHSPYYGTADATPLFLIVLDEYERWTGDGELVAELEPAARAALDWIAEWGDLDGDGYVEYATRNPEQGLVNQCWKDSWNSILHADGRLAHGPIATCEIQGYVYDARRRAARLARCVWDDEGLATRLEAQATELRRRFHADFWLEERRCYALALDGDKRPVDSLTSNVGHLLWSGIVDDEPAAELARHLLSDAMFSGWGVRTMAEGEGGYNPVEYHNGTVWPHDNSLIAAGLRRYGHTAAAARIAEALLSAAPYFDHRLPEAFAGCPVRLTQVPVAYPTACSPQAWAAGAPLLLLTSVLGLRPAPDGPRWDAEVPEAFGDLALRGIRGRWGRADVRSVAWGLS